jgi:hypothetical protein
MTITNLYTGRVGNNLSKEFLINGWFRYYCQLASSYSFHFYEPYWAFQGFTDSISRAKRTSLLRRTVKVFHLMSSSSSSRRIRFAGEVVVMVTPLEWPLGPEPGVWKRKEPRWGPPSCFSRLSTGNTKGGSITVPLTSWLTRLESAVWQLTIFCFYLQIGLIQNSQTGGQWYSDTSPFSIPCSVLAKAFGIMLENIYKSVVINEYGQ